MPATCQIDLSPPSSTRVLPRTRCGIVLPCRSSASCPTAPSDTCGIRSFRTSLARPRTTRITHSVCAIKSPNPSYYPKITRGALPEAEGGGGGGGVQAPFPLSTTCGSFGIHAINLSRRPEGHRKGVQGGLDRLRVVLSSENGRDEWRVESEEQLLEPGLHVNVTLERKLPKGELESSDLLYGAPEHPAEEPEALAAVRKSLRFLLRRPIPHHAELYIQ